MSFFSAGKAAASESSAAGGGGERRRPGPLRSAAAAPALPARAEAAAPRAPCGGGRAPPRPGAAHAARLPGSLDNLSLVRRCKLHLNPFGFFFFYPFSSPPSPRTSLLFIASAGVVGLVLFRAGAETAVVITIK